MAGQFTINGGTSTTGNVTLTFVGGNITIDGGISEKEALLYEIDAIKKENEEREAKHLSQRNMAQVL